MVVGVIGLIISAASAAYSARTQHVAAKAQAKQSKFNAEAEKYAAEQASLQEKYNRDAIRKEESQKLKKQRARIEAAYAKSGVGMEGTPEYALNEQAVMDEQYMQNQERISFNKQAGLDVSGIRAYQTGRLQASAYNYKARGALIGGTLSTAGAATQGYANYKANKANKANSSGVK